MSAGWVAGSVRARAMARGRLGPGAARRLAACRFAALTALQALAATPYGRARRPGQTLAAAQHAIAGALLWDLRVLAGWLPRDGVQLLRALAGWFEMANVDELLRRWPAARPGRIPAGRAGDRLAAAAPGGQPGRAAGGARRFGVEGPGRGDRAGDRLGMRARWAHGSRNSASLPGAGQLARAHSCWPASGSRPGRTVRPGAQVGRARPARLARGRGRYARRASQAAARPAAVGARPGSARRPTCGGPRRPGGRGWSGTGFGCCGSGLDSGPVLGAVAVMAADARRVRAALEIAARGGGPLEAFDAVA